MSSRYAGSGGGGSSRRPAPSYQTSSSSRNYSSASATDRDYSRSHLSGNGSSSAGYYSSSTSRKPESGGTTGYSYLEPNWIEKSRASIAVDPFASSYLDRNSLSASRDYTTAAAAAQPVYASAAAAALSVGSSSYGTGSSMPKAYARPDDFYRAAAVPAAGLAAYGYGNAFDQSTMAAQAAALYDLQHTKQRDDWQSAPASHHHSHHLPDYGRRDDRRGGDERRDNRGGVERRRDDVGGGRREERRGAPTGDTWRDRERDVARDRDRRPSLQSRDRGDRDMRVPAAPRRDDLRNSRGGGGEVTRRAEPAVRGGGGGGRHDQARDRDMRDSRDVPRRSAEKRGGGGAAAVDTSRLDRESRDLERQLAKVQRELQQLESADGRKGGSRERESDRSRRPVSSAAPLARRAAPPPRDRVSGGRPLPPRRSGPPPARAVPTRPALSYHTQRTLAVRPTRIIGRNARPTSALPSLLDVAVSRPGTRRMPVTTRITRSAAWVAPVRRGAAPLPPRGLPLAKRITGYAAKRGGGASGARGREPAMSSREKVRRAKEKLRRDAERRKRNDAKREERSKESREKRKEEDFAWLESIMSEDEEVDEETNRKLLLAPRQRRVLAIIDRDAVHSHTLENLQEKVEGDETGAPEEEEEPMLWTAEEADAIELLPIIDSASVMADVAAAFLAAHPEPAEDKEAAEPATNGANGITKMEE